MPLTVAGWRNFPAHRKPGICAALLGFVMLFIGVMLIGISSGVKSTASGLSVAGPVVLSLGIFTVAVGFTLQYVMHRQYKTRRPRSGRPSSSAGGRRKPSTKYLAEGDQYSGDTENGETGGSGYDNSGLVLGVQGFSSLPELRTPSPLEMADPVLSQSVNASGSVVIETDPDVLTPHDTYTVLESIPGALPEESSDLEYYYNGMIPESNDVEYDTNYLTVPNVNGYPVPFNAAMRFNGSTSSEEDMGPNVTSTLAIIERERRASDDTLVDCDTAGTTDTFPPNDYTNPPAVEPSQAGSISPTSRHPSRPESPPELKTNETPEPPTSHPDEPQRANSVVEDPSSRGSFSRRSMSLPDMISAAPWNGQVSLHGDEMDCELESIGSGEADVISESGSSDTDSVFEVTPKRQRTDADKPSSGGKNHLVSGDIHTNDKVPYSSLCNGHRATNLKVESPTSTNAENHDVISFSASNTEANTCSSETFRAEPSGLKGESVA